MWRKCIQLLGDINSPQFDNSLLKGLINFSVKVGYLQ